MSGDGPSASEMGITLGELPDKKPVTPKAILPPFSSVYTREPLPSQEVFSDSVKNLVLVPVRAELHNGNLGNFLTQLNEQQHLGKDKIGVVMFLNDSTDDIKDKPAIVEENQLTSQFLSLLVAKDRKGVDELELPEEYKELAKSIIDKDQLEIRFDYAHRQSVGMASFGTLRVNLFNLANSFKNPSTPGDETIVHLSDIDVHYSPKHFAMLNRFYEGDTHLANISEEDFIPSIHENPRGEDITRDLLATLDEFRFYRYCVETEFLLEGKLRSGTPMISGKLSYFMTADGQLKPPFARALGGSFWNEDFNLGQAMRSGANSLGKAVGNEGEVYRVHRARTPNGNLSTDGDEAFVKVKEIVATGGTSKFNFLRDGETIVDRYEQRLVHKTGSDAFKSSKEYQQAVTAALKDEQVKVRLRRGRLFDYIEFLAGKKELGKREQDILDPYIQYFGDETETMKQMLQQGSSPEQVGIHYLQKYDAFFNPASPLHIYIARMRGLKKYAFAHNIVAPKNNK